MMQAQVLVLMGVAGSGKSTLGQALAQRLGWAFYDGDDYHPPENVAKMSAGIPLSDADRWPWLGRLRALMEEHLAQATGAVLACSGLKRAYRQYLHQGDARVQQAFLQLSEATLAARLAARPSHFMRATMLASQFAALEPPHPEEGVWVLDGEGPLEALLADLVLRLESSTPSSLG